MRLVGKMWQNNKLTRSDRLFEVLDRLFLAGEAATLLVMQPAQLLKHLGVIWIALENALICTFGVIKL